MSVELIFEDNNFIRISQTQKPMKVLINLDEIISFIYEPDFNFLVSLGENFAEVSPIFPPPERPDIPLSKDEVNFYLFSNHPVNLGLNIHRYKFVKNHSIYL